MRRPKSPEKPPRAAKRPSGPGPPSGQEQEIHVDGDRWSGFRDSFGEREVGIDAEGCPIELLRLVREFTPVTQALSDRIARLTAFDRPAVARPLHLEQDDRNRRSRLILISDRVPGVRVSELLLRSIGRSLVPDLGVALFVMRRLLSTAALLQTATGVTHFIVAPERVVITPRGEVVVVEAALAGGIEALAASNDFPKGLRLAASGANAEQMGPRVDITRIARIGISLMLGRTIDADEGIDALSPALDEVGEVAAIRAGDGFSTALRMWLEQAVTIHADASFPDFKRAEAALEGTNPPSNCAASRLTLQAFLQDLALAHMSNPETVALEVERIRRIRTRQIAARPAAPERQTAWTEPVTHEEIAAEPLEGVHETGFTEEGEDLSIEPFEAAPQASQSSKDSMVRAVAERFGFVLRDAVGSKPPIQIVPPTVADRLVDEIEETLTLDSTVPVAFAEATETVEPVAEMLEEPVEEELVEIQPEEVAPGENESVEIESVEFESVEFESVEFESVDTESVDTESVDIERDDIAPARMVEEVVEPWVEEPSPAEVSFEQSFDQPFQATPSPELPHWWTRSAEDVAPVLDETVQSVDTGWKEAVVEPVVTKKRGERSWFRSVAKQLGLVHEAAQPPALETDPVAETRGAPAPPTPGIDEPVLAEPWFEEPVMPEEPVALEESSAFEEPVTNEEAIALEALMLLEEPAPLEEPALVEELALPEEPVAVEESSAFEEPVTIEEAIALEALVLLEEPAPLEEPVLAEESVLPEEPAAREEPAMFEEPVPLDEPALVEESAPPEEQAVLAKPDVSEEPVTLEEPGMFEAPGFEPPPLVKPWSEEPALLATSLEKPGEAAPAAALPLKPTPSTEDVAVALDERLPSVEAGQEDATQAPWPAETVDEPTTKKRSKRSWFRSVAKQFGMAHEAVEQPTAETTAPVAETLEEIEATPATPFVDERMLVTPWLDGPEVLEEPAEPATIDAPSVFAAPATTEEPSALEGPVMILEGPVMIAEPVMTAQPVLAARPVTIMEPVKTSKPVKMSKPVTIAAPVLPAKPVTIAQPVMIAKPVTIVEPMAIERPAVPKEPVTIAVPLLEQMWIEAPPVPQIPNWGTPVADEAVLGRWPEAVEKEVAQKTVESEPPDTRNAWIKGMATQLGLAPQDERPAPREQRVEVRPPAPAPPRPQPEPARRIPDTSRPLVEVVPVAAAPAVRIAPPRLAPQRAAQAPRVTPAPQADRGYRVPDVAAAASQFMRAATIFVVSVGVVGGLAWAGRQYYIRQTTPGTVVVESNPRGAEVLVDGASKGLTPLTIALSPGKHALELRRRGVPPRQITLDVSPGEQLKQQIDLSNTKAVGTLVVTTSPKGARVLVDGKERGVTPLTLSDLSPGAHAVVLDSADEGSIRRDVQIQAGGSVTLDEAIFSGWIAVFAPSELQIYEGKRFLGTTETERILLKAGRHQLDLVNTHLGFRETRTVDVNPGATVAVNVLSMQGTLRIIAPAGAEVFVDGVRVGETPLAEQHVSLGTREIVVKHPQLGERRIMATVTSSAPAEVNVDFR